jgi:hypothetical protein
MGRIGILTITMQESLTILKSVVANVSIWLEYVPVIGIGEI